MTIKEIYKHFSKKFDSIEGIYVTGWIRSIRDNGRLAFIDLYDGTCFKTAQIVITEEVVNFSDVVKFRNGSAIKVVGNAIYSSKQVFDINAKEVELISSSDEDYPLQKKRHGFEFLREIAHLRPRTNSFAAIFRIRSELAYAIHTFFIENDFVHLHSPIISSNDAEGAGECFSVGNKVDGKYNEDFFGKHAMLTVTGQLNAEAFIFGFNKVYTFGPTFRAEKSNTARHASEFWMIEPEMAFTDLKGNIEVIEKVIKYAVKTILDRCPDEIKFCNDRFDPTLITRLGAIINKPFAKITYTKVIELLQSAVEDGYKFVYKDIKWGMDLQSEHERYIAEVVVNGPVFITDYPKEIKAFYMKLNEDGKTVAACDLLVPKIGELVGGSQREDNYDILKQKMEQCGIDPSSMDWYLDLRRYGSITHSGFGIGFERLLMYITGIENIRDAIPFPRTPRNLLF